ncbi:MAG: hypothetical protein HDT37_00270 [Clostridiales bacterium]|nr:hypothetical protein [Clostridiales bacterium]
MDKERAALDSISNCIAARLRGQVQYSSKNVAEKRRREVPVISPQVQNFWDSCICTFEERIIAPFDGQNLKLRKGTKGCGKATFAQDSPAEDDAGHSHFTEPIYSHITASEQAVRESSLELVQKEDIIKLLNELRTKLEKYEERNIRKQELNGFILGTVNLERLPYMLNLQDKSVCELLPYLLTAFIFNSWRNRSFAKEMRLVLLICGEDITSRDTDPLDSITISRMIPKAKKLAQVFSLKQMLDSKNKRAALLHLDPGTRNDRRPVPWYAAFYQMDPQSIESPYIKYKEMLDHVYDSWCSAIQECAPLAGIEAFPLDIDWDACQKLYSSYTTASRN